MAGIPYIPTRYIFTALVSIGFAINYGLTVNLSVAIVVMVNSTELLAMLKENDDHYESHDGLNASGFLGPEFACPSPEIQQNTTIIHQDGPFPWPEPTQGLVLGAYFWGYIWTQIPGGRMAEIYSAKWVLFVSVLINAVFAILTPLAANLSYICIMVVRFVEGLSAGVYIPAMQVMLSKWTPLKERNTLSSLAYAGAPLGIMISLPFSGILAASLGWESIFYIEGGLASIWCILWIFFAFDSPQEHPRIQPKEMELFEKTVKGDQKGQKNLSVPWKDLICSGPFWAILVAHICNNFGWYILLVELPTYMKHVLRFNIRENALLSAVPYLSMWIFSFIWSKFLDWAKNKGWISTTAVRKISTSLASLVPAACFVGVSFAGCNRELAVAFMTLGATCMAGTSCGIFANHIDIAPNYAGTLMALTCAIANLTGFIVPVFVGELTHGNQSLERWQIIMWTTAAVLFLEFVFYVIMGSGEEQPWNHSSKPALKHTMEGDRDPEVSTKLIE